MSPSSGESEERVQVDRRRLEAMIRTPSASKHPITKESDEERNEASDFFAEVERRTGARIFWPSRLKIGAKTKKGAFYFRLIILRIHYLSMLQTPS